MTVTYATKLNHYSGDSPVKSTGLKWTRVVAHDCGDRDITAAEDRRPPVQMPLEGVALATPLSDRHKEDGV
jgi:hypothetical protein